MNNNNKTEEVTNTQVAKGGFKYYIKKVGDFILDVLCIF